MEDSPVSGGETQSIQQAVVEATVVIGGPSQLYVAHSRVTLFSREDCSRCEKWPVYRAQKAKMKIWPTEVINRAPSQCATEACEQQKGFYPWP